VIPANATIGTATLRIYSYNTGEKAQARKITTNWSEDSVTYKNRPKSSGPATNFFTEIGWVEIDVTAIVQAWANGEPVRGIHLQSNGKNGSDYYSSEHGASTPELVISYTP
jgi:hypothetical protein